MSNPRVDPQAKLAQDRLVRKVSCPVCHVDAGTTCKVISNSDEIGRKRGQYRTTSHLERWQSAQHDPATNAELDKIKVDQVRLLWESITGLRLSEAQVDRFQGDPDARRLSRMKLDVVRRAGIISWGTSNADHGARALRLTAWATLAVELVNDEKVAPVTKAPTTRLRVSEADAAAATELEIKAAWDRVMAAQNPKHHRNVNGGSGAHDCKAMTKTRKPCPIRSGPSGYCHVHDPSLQCGYPTGKGRCAVPTGGSGLCPAHRRTAAK